jgi:hypothetical protein
LMARPSQVEIRRYAGLSDALATPIPKRGNSP